MLLIIFGSILVGLIFGDILCFIVYHLCKLLSEEENNKKQKKKAERRIFREYIDYVFKQLKENRKHFIAYYLLLDVITVSFTIIIVISFGITLKSAAALLFCYSLIALTFIDAKTQYLPDVITKPLIAFGLIQGYFEIFTTFKESIIGALAGYWVLWVINTTFRLIRKKDGMGQGDFKLLSALGAWVGYVYLPFIIFASSVLGIFVALGLAKFADNELSAPSPFGPSLAIAGIISLLWGEQIINWYFSLYVIQ